jgi:hypothetical protein
MASADERRLKKNEKERTRKAARTDEQREADNRYLRERYGALTPEKRAHRTAIRKAWEKRFKERHGITVAVARRLKNPAAYEAQREKQKLRFRNDPALRAREKAKREASGYHRDYYLAIKVAVFDAYGGPVCVCCGEQHIAFLTLDHVNDDGATHRRSIKGRNNGSAGSAFYHYLKMNGYPNDPPLQVLCANCNQGKRGNNGVCPHQEGT